MSSHSELNMNPITFLNFKKLAIATVCAHSRRDNHRVDNATRKLKEALRQ